MKTPTTLDLIPQDEVTALWGVTDGILKGLRSRKAGPFCIKLDYQEKFRYQRDQVEEIGAALSVLRKFGLVLHGVAQPASPVARYYEKGTPCISQAKAIARLGITANVARNWRDKAIGPRCIRSHPKQAWRYIETEVEELRAALRILGEYAMGLPGLPPLRA
jgi:hypothetical protein